MPKYRLETALDRIATYAVDTGDAVTERHAGELVEFSTDRGEKHTLSGHRCSTDGSTYLVAGHPELRFVVVIYPYDIPAGLSNQLDDTTFEELTDGEVDETGRGTTAAKQLLTGVEQQRLADIQYQLRRLSAGSETTVEFIDETLAVFVTEQLFPYEQRFSIEEFAACRSRVVSLGETVQAAIERAISVELDEAGDPSLVVETDRI